MNKRPLQFEFEKSSLAGNGKLKNLRNKDSTQMKHVCNNMLYNQSTASKSICKPIKKVNRSNEKLLTIKKILINIYVNENIS